eukprot:GSMAST32.ASY1.ANO1.1552.1 assembled CDS
MMESPNKMQNHSRISSVSGLHLGNNSDKSITDKSITGFVVRRRCLGKNLAFLTIQTDNGELCQVVFSRSSKYWTATAPFPEKSSMLQHNMRLELDCKLGVDAGEDNLPVVTSYRVLSRISVEAQHAGFNALSSIRKLNNDARSSNATSISAMFQYRNEAFVSARKAEPKCLTERMKKVKHSNSKKRKSAYCNKQNISHGSNKEKRFRAKVMAQWLIDTFSVKKLSRGNGIVDVAGGKGQLSIEFLLLCKIKSTVIDPMLRKTRLNARNAKRLPFFAATDEFVKLNRSILVGASLFVGMHPDQATEAIVDAAIRFNTLCAVVPCCVFPCLFPNRKLRSGFSVTTYEDFITYLLEKDSRLKKQILPFEGRNIVLYADFSVELPGEENDCVRNVEV